MHDYKGENTSDFVLKLAINAQEYSHYFPVNRAFLEPITPSIYSFDHRDFILCNLELKNDLYVTKLFLCLPEIWDDISIDDIVEIAKRISNPTSFNMLLKFTYKYLEIDVLKSLVSIAVYDRSTSFSEDILQYLDLQYNTFIKSELEIEEYYTDENWGVDLEKWLYIKQRLLLRVMVKPALKDVTALQRNVNDILKRFRNR